MKRLLFLGDSITEGLYASCNENNYVNLVHKYTGIECQNFGVSGTRIARQKHVYILKQFDYYFLQRAKKMPVEADLVFVFGGTNDYGHGDALFGTMNDTTSDTFCGAVNNLFKYLKKKYSSKKVVVIPPLHRTDENVHKTNNLVPNGKKFYVLSDYRKTILDYASKYEFDVLDIVEQLGTKSETNDNFVEDGLHPNDNGHKLIAELICNYIKNRK